jgi:F0F1-type ATP synthase delta subunit
MSIVLSKVAEPYEEALLDLAKSNDSLKETTNDVNIVSQFLANSSDLKKVFKQPFNY